VWTWTHTLSFLKPEATLATNPSSIGQWASTLALLAILASSAGIIIGLLRGLSAMLGSDDREDVVRQPILASMMVLALAALVIVLGLYPQLFLGLVQSAAQAFSLF
jgi:NADH:ubiquinone oxidoreductase subunit 2 (subunit N)